MRGRRGWVGRWILPPSLVKSSMFLGGASSMSSWASRAPAKGAGGARSCGGSSGDLQSPASFLGVSQ
eukprot:1383777-Pyramimonas_sp.AAC.1